MFAENTRGSNSPIYVETHGRDAKGYDSMMVLAVMIILIVFIFVIFAIFAMRGHKGGNGIAEVAAVGMLANQQNNRGHGMGEAYQLIHDNNRDMLKGHAIIEKEVSLTAMATQKNTDDRFFELYKETVNQGEKTREQAYQTEIQRLNGEVSRIYAREEANRVIADQRLHFNYQSRPVVQQQHIIAENGVGGFGHEWR